MSLGPTTIYLPEPIAIQNSDFQADQSVPPSGWTEFGTINSITYDTTTPYGDYQQSLAIDAFSAQSGIQSNSPFQVRFGQVYGISAAVKSVTGAAAIVQLVFFDANGNKIYGYLSGNGLNYQPEVQTTSSSWQLLSSQGTVPYGAATAAVQCLMAGFSISPGTGEFGFVSVTLLSNAIPYYLSLIPSQFQNAEKFKQLLAVLLQPLVDVGIFAAGLNGDFDIASAVGAQLDTLGMILGASRNLPAVNNTGQITSAVVNNPGSGYVVGNQVSITQGGASGGVLQLGTFQRWRLVSAGTGYSTATGLATSDISGTGSGLTVNIVAGSSQPAQVLDDDHYRTLLQAKILQNEWDGQADSLWTAWQRLFPGGNIYITDNQNMTATIFLTGAFDAIYQQMILSGLVVPRPEAVLYTYEFGNFPLFGFGNLNPSLVEGFGTGSGGYTGGNWA